MLSCKDRRKWIKRRTGEAWKIYENDHYNANYHGITAINKWCKFCSQSNLIPNLQNFIWISQIEEIAISGEESIDSPLCCYTLIQRVSFSFCWYQSFFPWVEILITVCYVQDFRSLVFHNFKRSAPQKCEWFVACSDIELISSTHKMPSLYPIGLKRYLQGDNWTGRVINTTVWKSMIQSPNLIFLFYAIERNIDFLINIIELCIRKIGQKFKFRAGTGSVGQAEIE